MGKLSLTTLENLQNGYSYNYEYQMKESIIDAIDYLEDAIMKKSNPFDSCLADWLADVCDFLDGELYNNDDVTGNRSGSYTLSRYEAAMCITQNNSIDLNDIVAEGLITHQHIGELVANGDWEILDVIIRCSVFERSYQYQLLDDDDIKTKLVSMYLTYIEVHYND